MLLVVEPLLLMLDGVDCGFRSALLVRFLAALHTADLAMPRLRVQPQRLRRLPMAWASVCLMTSMANRCRISSRKPCNWKSRFVI